MRYSDIDIRRPQSGFQGWRHCCTNPHLTTNRVSSLILEDTIYIYMFSIRLVTYEYLTKRLDMLQWELYFLALSQFVSLSLSLQKLPSSHPHIVKKKKKKKKRQPADTLILKYAARPTYRFTYLSQTLIYPGSLISLLY